MQDRDTSVIPMVAAVVGILVVLGGGVLLWYRHQTTANTRPVTKFLIENAATPGKSSSDFAQEQLTVGDTVRIDMSYDPKLMTAVSVRFVASNGQTAKTTSTSSLSPSGSFNTSIPTVGMAADIYRVELLNQNQKVVDFGELTLTPAK
jgi:hypothetical protein